MRRMYWLASYPKSGNTWFRILLANLATKGAEPVDINELPDLGGGARSRGTFDHVSLVDSSLLTLDEIDALRPRFYAYVRGGGEGVDDGPGDGPPVRFAKTHDAYIANDAGEPLLAAGADGAIVLVRDPRDIAASLAHHNGSTIDEAIALMHRPDAMFWGKPHKFHGQFRQKLLTWSRHVASWLGQSDIPVHLVRYEDLKADTASCLRRALAFVDWPNTEADIEQAVRCASFARLRTQELAHGFSEAPRPHAGGNFFRRGETGSWRDELNERQIALIEEQNAATMRQLGYELSAIPIGEAS